MKRLRGYALGTAAILWSAVPVYAAALRVPEDYPTLLAGVDAATAGDSVLVGPGVYTTTAVRPVVINGQSLLLTAAAFLRPGITIVASGGPDVTTVDGGAVGICFVMGATVGTDTTVVSGFTTTGLECLEVSAAPPVVIENCRAVDCRLDAVGASAGASVTLRGCTIERSELDRTSATFGALYSVNSTLELYDCVIQDNNQRGIRAKGGGRLVMERCYVAGHSLSTDGGGGMYVDQVPDFQVRDSWFVRNKSVIGGAIYVTLGAVGSIEFCVFLEDSSSGSGGGINVSAPVRVSSNTFVACDAVNFGSAISIQPDLAGVDHNIIANCSAQDGAIVLWAGTPMPISGCNLFWQNSGGDFSTVGFWTASPTDIFADPQFCDFPLDDFTLRTSSPAAALNQPVCGQIGAFGTACGPVSVQDRSWGDIKGSYR